METATFKRWWQAWAERNEALYVEAQRVKELAVAKQWAEAHIRFHFGDSAVNSTQEDQDNEQNRD